MFHDQYLDQVRNIIKEHCYALQAVGPDHEHGVSGFVYTVGQTISGRPEIIAILNIDLNLIASCIKSALIETNGRNFKDWIPVDKVLKDYPVVFREVTPKSARSKALIAKALYPDFRLVQMFFPDGEGRFPWNANCDEVLRAQECLDYVSPRQTVHYLTRSSKAKSSS